VKEFGRTKSAAFSYIWGSDRTVVLFNVNDESLFLLQEFFTADFRDLLKASLEKEPTKHSKESQMRLEFQTDEQKDRKELL
jgi:hypothetical protein